MTTISPEQIREYIDLAERQGQAKIRGKLRMPLFSLSEALRALDRESPNKEMALHRLREAISALEAL